MSVETSLGTATSSGIPGSSSPSNTAGGSGNDAGVSRAAGEAMQQTKAVASEAKQHATQMADQTRHELRQQVDQRSQQLTSSLQGLAGQFRSLRDGRPEEAGALQHYLVDAEQKVYSWAQKLEQGGPDMMLREMRMFARRKPGTFLLGALGAGFLAGRAVRVGIAASHDDSGQSGQSGQYGGYGEGAAGARGYDPLVADAPLTTPGIAAGGTAVIDPAGSSGAFA